MPELPEVETTVSSLKNKVLNRTFVCVWAEEKSTELEKIKGKKIRDVKRFGKGIFISLSSGDTLFVHLKMTGHLLLGNWKLVKDPLDGKKIWKAENKTMREKVNGFLRYVFFLDNGEKLALSDLRKFARVSVFSKKEAENYIKKLGPDPLLIGKKEFKKLFAKKKKEIKPLLMDQNFIAGIGNIYASEILFKTGTDPRKKASNLTDKELEKIYHATKILLKKGIRLKGDSTSDYRLLDGKKGGYQNHHLVYKRQGLSCFNCKKKIERIKVGGRGTYFCPQCQR